VRGVWWPLSAHFDKLAPVNAAVNGGRNRCNRGKGNRVTLRVLLDSCIYDEIIASPNLLDRVHKLIRNKIIEILQPHIVRGQLENAPESKREQLLSIPARVVPVDGFLTGYSSAGDRVGSGSSEITIDDVLQNKKPTCGNNRDALIATTAATEADIFVTIDRKLRNRVNSMKPSIRVWNFVDFESHLAQL
jgi:hypothetical protein